MPTNKVVLRSVEQVMNDFTPVYSPIFPLILSSAKSQSYNAEVGTLSFQRLEAVGDIRAKRITPKDTEIEQIQAKESSKTYKKYFNAKQFILSSWQDRQGIEAVQFQVLDELNKQADELLMMGDGTSNSNMLNNGIYFSDDANYQLENSVAIASSERLTDFHTKVVATASTADLVAGRKMIIFYGNVLPYFDSLYPTSQIAFKTALQNVLGSNYSLVKAPAGATPAGDNGWVIVNLDQVKPHYTMVPKILDQNINAEKMYQWTNFAMGSFMVEVLAQYGIVRQPTTLA